MIYSQSILGCDVCLWVMQLSAQDCIIEEQMGQNLSSVCLVLMLCDTIELLYYNNSMCDTL